MAVSARSKARALVGDHLGPCYVGVRIGPYPGRCSVFRADGRDEIGLVDPRNDLWDHSPDGFEWGYGGSGPAQLALAILADHFGPNGEQAAVRLRMAFKFSVVACLPKSFVLPVHAITLWLECVTACGTGNHARLRGVWLTRMEALGIDTSAFMPHGRRPA